MSGSNSTSISAPTGFFAGNVAAAQAAEDLQSAIVAAEAVVAAATTQTQGSTAALVNPITSDPIVATIAGTDFVGISQGGLDAKITLANLLSGETIDVAAAAGAVSDTDTFWTGQGSNVMLRQTQASVWPWVSAKMASYKRPVIELSANTTLDGTVHNMALLIVSSPITVTPNFSTMGSGFQCDLINLSGGSVTWGTGIVTSGGSTTLATGNSARISAATYSGGNLVFASTGQVTAAVAAPGQVTGLTAGAATASTQALSWAAPTSGGATTAYTVQYKVHGATAWITCSTAITGLSCTVSPLTQGTSYDYQVIPTNSGGNGTASATVTASTLAGTVTTPGTTTGLTAGSPLSNSIALTWTAPTTGGAPANYIVQYQLTGATSWTTASNTVTATSYTVTGLTSNTGYTFQVAALNSAGAGAYSATVSATTGAASNYLLTDGYAPVASGNYTQSISTGGSTIAINLNDNSLAGDGSHTNPTSMTLGFSTSSTVAPTSTVAYGYQYQNGGHNYWALYASPPQTPGVYYVWSFAYNGSALVATHVSGFTITMTA